MKSHSGEISMETLPFGLYIINADLLKAQQAVEPKISDADYQDRGRHEKFYIGPLGISTVPGAEGMPIFAPVSHSVPYKDKKDLRELCTIIKNNNGLETQCIKHQYSTVALDIKDVRPVYIENNNRFIYEFCQKNKAKIIDDSVRFFKQYDYCKRPTIDLAKVTDVVLAGMEEYDLIDELVKKYNLNAKGVQIPYYKTTEEVKGLSEKDKLMARREIKKLIRIHKSEQRNMLAMLDYNEQTYVKKVFISGSESVKSLDPKIVEIIRNLKNEKNCEIIVGDSPNGVDALVQDIAKQENIPVTVYCSGEKCRHCADPNWKIEHIETKEKRLESPYFYKAKDIAMVRACDEAIVISNNNASRNIEDNIRYLEALNRPILKIKQLPHNLVTIKKTERKPDDQLAVGPVIDYNNDISHEY